MGILNREYSGRIVIPEVTIPIPNHPVIAIGQTLLRDGWRACMKFEAHGPVYKKIYLEEDFLRGALLINAPAEADRLRKWIAERTPLNGGEEELLKSESPLGIALD